MCGIVGYIDSRNAVSEGLVRKLRDRLVHRGPDDSGIWKNDSGSVCFGHRRLAILDLSSAAHQPMVSACGRFAIVFNGEIYNYLDIKEALIKRGYVFCGSGDTEVVLAAYQEWGASAVEQFNGMFALAIYDSGSQGAEEKVFLARDQVGEKPLYFKVTASTFEFASELKSLPGLEGIDPLALNHYLAMGCLPSHLCIAKNIQKIPPGHAGEYDIKNGSFRIWQYWKLPDANEYQDISPAELADETWKLLRNSVGLRMHCDVPVGVFLSGGLDSSLVTAAAVSAGDHKVQTFTVSNPGSPLDESDHARSVADWFDTEHHVLELPKPSLDAIDQLAPYVDEPLADSSILPAFLVSALTARQVKVALGGDGGDELFGGYTYYQQLLRDKSRFGRIPIAMLRLVGKLAAKLPAGVKGRNRLASMRHGIDQSRVWGTPYFDIDLRKRIINKEVLLEIGDEFHSPESSMLELMGDRRDIVDAQTRADFCSTLPDDYLVKVDRASMANSLEVRSPYLDARLVEYAFSQVPSDWKVNNNERRRVQNLLAREHLPPNFELARKQGFSVPMDQWLRQVDIRDRLESLPDCINRLEVENLIKGHDSGRANGARLFSLIMLSISQENLGSLSS